MTSVDLISIMRYKGGSVDILQDFTSDRDRLLSILETMIVGEGQDSAEDRRRRQQRRHRRGLRPGRQRVQHLQHRPPALRAADRGQDAGPAQREEVADLLRQRPAPERHRQPGAAARHRRRGHQAPACPSGRSMRAAWWQRRRWAMRRRARPATQACIPAPRRMP